MRLNFYISEPRTELIEIITYNMMDNRTVARLICLLLMILTCDAIPTVYHKSYNESLALTCPAGCDANDCSITINGENTTATATVRNGQIVLRSREWSDYGTVCCGDSDQQFCYQICPQYTEICEDCLQLSANITTAAVGGVIMITSGMVQQPHNGISLSINGSISTNPDFACHTKSSVLSHQVIYYCTARKTGMVTVQSNTVFCNTELSSQRINITVEEQRATTDRTQNGVQDVTVTTNVTLLPSSDMTIPETIITTTDIIPSTSSDVITTMAIPTSTPSINNTISVTSTATNDPNDTGSSDGTIAIVITIVVVTILGLLLTAVALFMLGRLCGYQFRIPCRF